MKKQKRPCYSGDEDNVTEASSAGGGGESTHLLGSASGKEPACKAADTGDVGLFPGSGRSPVGGNGNPLQYSYLENPRDRGGYWARVHGVAKSQT